MTLGVLEFRPWRGGILRAEVPGERAFATWDALRGPALDAGGLLVLAGDAAEFDAADWTFLAPSESVSSSEMGAAPDLDTARAEFGEVDIEALLEADLVELIEDADAVTDDEFEILPSVTVLWMPGTTVREALTRSGLRIGPSERDPEERLATADVVARWAKVYGTTLMAIGPSWYELTRRAPVADPDLAAVIALEIAAVAPEVVRQGAETIQALAEEIMSRRHWLVWWPAPDGDA